MSAPAVRIGTSAVRGEARSRVLLCAPAAVSERLELQLWVRTVLIEQRRRTVRAGRAAFDARADCVLQQLDPDTHVAGEDAPSPATAPATLPLGDHEPPRVRLEQLQRSSRPDRTDGTTMTTTSSDPGVWERLVAAVAELGYSVLFVDYVECVDCPGLLGMAEGAIIYSKRVSGSAQRWRRQSACVLEHELEHAGGPGADIESGPCGN